MSLPLGIGAIIPYRVRRLLWIALTVLSGLVAALVLLDWR